MPTPNARQEKISPAEPYLEEKTYYSDEKNADGEPYRTYHVRRVDTGSGSHYEVSMEVVSKEAVVDVLGRPLQANEDTRTAWENIWEERSS